MFQAGRFIGHEITQLGREGLTRKVDRRATLPDTRCCATRCFRVGFRPLALAKLVVVIEPSANFSGIVSHRAWSNPTRTVLCL